MRFWTGGRTVTEQNEKRHAYKPFPRGDHAIIVRLCYDCDNWHAEDDSLLYNEGRKQDWASSVADLEARLAAETKARLDAELMQAVEAKSAERWLAHYQDAEAKLAAAEARAALADEAEDVFDFLDDHGAGLYSEPVNRWRKRYHDAIHPHPQEGQG